MNIFEFDHLEQLTEAIEKEHNTAVVTFNQSYEYAMEAPPGEETHVMAAIAGVLLGASVLFTQDEMQHFWYMYENSISIRRDEVDEMRHARGIAVTLYEQLQGLIEQLPEDLALPDAAGDSHIRSIEEILDSPMPEDLSELDGDNPGGYL